MKNIAYRLALMLALALSFNIGWAKPVDTIETYGIYVVAEKGYVKVGSYNSRNERYVDFKYLNEIPFVTRADKSLKLVVYEKNFNSDGNIFTLRPLEMIVDLKEIKFDVKPLAKPDMYELSTDNPVGDNVVLQVNSGFYGNNFGAIMLGEPQTQLVKYFSQKNLPDAPIVIQFLDDARVAFPANTELKELTKYWTKAAEEAKDIKGYSYVEEKWNQYQQTDNIKLKARYLNDLIGEINGYLNDHPNGSKAAEAKQRKKHAEEKLKEYEKMLS